MSGVSFLSSPLRSPNSCQPNPRIFFTPQAKSAWDLSYKLPALSPLRTSNNANVMPLRKTKNKLGENLDLEDTQNDQLLPSPSEQSQSDCGTFVTQPATHTTSSFFLGSTPSVPPVDSKSSIGATQFQFQARARASSPSVQLQSHTASNRDSRKRLFLDRLRTKRDTERYERSGDQLLRMDYIRERRAWESEMRSRELRDIEMDGMETDYAEQMTPEDDCPEDDELSPTEDKEIDELVSYLECNENEAGQAEDDFSDEDYDALFMEVLNKEPWDASQLTSVVEPSSGQHHTTKGDTDMDMS